MLLILIIAAVCVVFIAAIVILVCVRNSRKKNEDLARMNRRKQELANNQFGTNQMSQKAPIQKTMNQELDDMLSDSNTLAIPNDSLTKSILLDLYKNGVLIKSYNATVNGSIIVGRGEICDVVIHDSKISRQHFAFEYDGESLYIQDLNTKNGTIFNGVKMTHKRRVESGDKINIGDIEIVVRW